MKRIFVALSLLLMIFGTCGCQKRYGYAAYREKLGEWIGKNSDTLYAYWGKPNVSEELDANTHAITYYQTEKIPAYYSFTPYLEQLQNKTMDAAEDMGYDVERKEPPSYYCRVTFVIHNNLVTEYDFDGENCY